jgi:hypothetical protein
VSIADRQTEIVTRLHRAGLKPRAISRELRDTYGIDLNVAQVTMVIENRDPDGSRGDPPAAALDAILEAHLLLHEVKIRKADIIEAARRKAADEGLEALDIRNRCHAASSTQDGALIQAINAIRQAEAAYLASGGSRDEIDRALTIHFHASDAGTAPTPTPGVLDV